ncbi:tripartite motif-containing protein 36 [Pelomyxa schiedti]|nr:tripartite motif-containing protein 36 [Pelomyxa schiedti]
MTEKPEVSVAGTLTEPYIPLQCACCGTPFLLRRGASSTASLSTTPPKTKRPRRDEPTHNPQMAAVHGEQVRRYPVLLSPCGHHVCRACWSASSTTNSAEHRPCATSSNTTTTTTSTGTASAVGKNPGYRCPACGCSVICEKEHTLLMDVLTLMDSLGCPIAGMPDNASRKTITIKQEEGDSLGPEQQGNSTKSNCSSSVASISRPSYANAVMCDECEVNGAVVWCEKEETSLCAECDRATHSFRITQSHVRVPIGNKPALTLHEPKCKVHSGKDLVLWCEDDKELCCHICKESGSHKGHKISVRDDACSTARESFLDAACKVVENLKSNEDKVRELQNASAQVKLEADTIRLQIQEEFSSLREALSKRESELRTHLDTSESELLLALSQQTSRTLFSVTDSKVLHGSLLHTVNFPNTFTTLQVISGLNTLGNSYDLQPKHCESQLAEGPWFDFAIDKTRISNSVPHLGRISVLSFPAPQVKVCLDIASNSAATITSKLPANTPWTVPPTFEVQLAQQDCDFTQVYFGQDKETKVTSLQPGTRYITRVKAMFIVGGIGQDMIMSSDWSEISFTMPIKAFMEPGRYKFTVPEGLRTINAIAIGGGGAGASWCGNRCYGGNGGDSCILGILVACGGSSRGSGGQGSRAKGGDGSSEGGGGGGAGGAPGNGGTGGAATFDYAGCGGSKGSFCSDNSPPSQSGNGAMPPFTKDAQAGWRFGGGGGGAMGSSGGGGGGYSTVMDHPVTPGQVLDITVGQGGAPRELSGGSHTGGHGASGLGPVPSADRRAVPVCGPRGGLDCGTLPRRRQQPRRVPRPLAAQRNRPPLGGGGGGPEVAVEVGIEGSRHPTIVAFAVSPTLGLLGGGPRLVCECVPRPLGWTGPGHRLAVEIRDGRMYQLAVRDVEWTEEEGHKEWAMASMPRGADVGLDGMEEVELHSSVRRVSVLCSREWVVVLDLRKMLLWNSGKLLLPPTTVPFYDGYNIADLVDDNLIVVGRHEFISVVDLAKSQQTGKMSIVMENTFEILQAKRAWSFAGNIYLFAVDAKHQGMVLCATTGQKLLALGLQMVIPIGHCYFAVTDKNTNSCTIHDVRNPHTPLRSFNVENQVMSLCDELVLHKTTADELSVCDAATGVLIFTICGVWYLYQRLTL